MQKITADDLVAASADIVAANIEQLKALFPEAVTEGKIDFEVLKQVLGGAVEEREEKYGLNWHGKRRARQLALTPSTGTLRPCPEESVDWNTTQNLMIEGDNLEVLKLLQKSYAGKVKLIYIDPPYNTGKDFVYPDDFQDNIKNYQMLTGQIDSDGRKVTSNTETSGRFHTEWLNMMYPRLRVARNLLRQNGAIFVSIGDQEVARLRLVMDDIFGEENFIATIVWQKKQSPQNDATNVSDMHDYVVVYAKQARTSNADSEGWLRNKIEREASQEARYSNRDNDPRGDWTSGDLTCNKTAEERPNLYFSIRNPITRREVWPSKTRVWGYEKPVMKQLLDDNRIWWGTDGQNVPRLKVFRSEVDDGVVPSTWWTRDFASDNQDARRELRALFPEGDVFDTPKPTRLIR
jgi:adenine-specific DNA-methyltransferase